MEEIIGTVSIREKRFGFLRTEKEDYFLSKEEIRNLFNGEIIKASIIKNKNKKEAKLINFVKRKEFFLGKVFKEGKHFYSQASPLHKIKIEDFNGNTGDIIKYKIITYPDKKVYPVGKYIDTIGHEESPKIENKLAIFKHEIPSVFSQQSTNQTQKISEKITFENRFNLKDLNFVTIDGSDSRDFDDAVFCEKTNFGWILYVAIADVSHYVKENTPLDKEAFERGNSVYFPNECIPMLPEKLSNELCSIKPNVERNSLVVKMNISKNGNIKSFKFMNAVIKSKARLTYDQVADMIEDNNESVIDKFSHVFKDLKQLEKLYDVLKENKNKRGALEFEKRENQVVFDKNNSRIEDVLFYNRRISHKMIEESMLCANICAAKLFQKLKVDALYRVHDSPSTDRIESVKKSLQNIGLSLRGGEETKTYHIKVMMDMAKERQDKDFIETTLLKCLPRASYQVENRGHFGLAYDEYTHFTSPIRRYSDLIVHRAIKAVIASNEGSKYVLRINNGIGKIKDYYHYEKEDLSYIAAHISMTERRADSASNDVYDALKCHFLSNKIGETFKGKITHFTKSFLCFEFDDFIMEGIVKYSNMPDYFTYFPEKGKIRGEKTKKEFKLGDKVEAVITNIDYIENKVFVNLKYK